MAASLDGLQGIFYVDQEAPEAKLRQKLVAFAEAGGTLFVRAKWSNPEGSPIELSSAENYLLFNERKLGKGRLAVAKTDELDPYFTITDIQSIMSHRGDPIRLYNASSMNCFCQVAPQGQAGVIHVMNYSRRPGGDAPLIFMKTPYKSVRFVSPDAAAPVALAWTPQGAGGAELLLPPIAVYGAVQMEN